MAELGRRDGFKIRCPSQGVRVQVPPRAHLFGSERHFCEASARPSPPSGRPVVQHLFNSEAGLSLLSRGYEGWELRSTSGISHSACHMDWLIEDWLIEITSFLWTWTRNLTVQHWTNILLTVFTGVYVRLTYLILQERRRERQPDVYAELQSERSLSISLLVSNRGDAPARNVSVYVVKDKIDWHNEEHTLQQASIVKNGREYIRPGGQINYPIGTLNFNASNAEDKEEIEHGDVEIIVTYENESGRDFGRVIEYKFSDQEESQLQTIQTPSGKMSSAIRSAGKSISNKLQYFDKKDTRETMGLDRWDQPVLIA